jgi:hypothetical protein
MRGIVCGFFIGTACLALAACGTNPFTGLPITAASVDAAAKQACGFLPTASTVARILTANPAVATAEEVAGIICGAVTAAPATQGARLKASGASVSVTAIVSGVPVKISGTFQ